MGTTNHPIELSMEDFESLLARAQGKISDEDHQMLRDLAASYAYVLRKIESKQTTIRSLRRLIFGSGTEKTRAVADRVGGQSGEDPSGSNGSEEESPSASSRGSDQGSGPGGGGTSPKRKRRGHGRNGASDYPGAEKIRVNHATLKSGDECPSCHQGKVYEQSTGGVLIRLTGQAPVHASVYELQALRCNLCGEVFKASAPAGVGSEKYDASSTSMIALLHYGSGMAFNRLENLQGGLGIPLPRSTQWDVVQAAAGKLMPAYEALINQAAQGEILHNDDTWMRILELMGKRAKKEALAEDAPPQRRAVFTSGIVSEFEGHRIALFFTGAHHAGEKLEEVLSRRVSERAPPIQMCDALSRNMSKDLQVIVANCLAHGRRKFVEVSESFPEESLHVLRVLKEVYKVDAEAKRRRLKPESRLALHQAKSKPKMDELHQWLTEQIEGQQVEPNSSVGKAIRYMLNHWKKLTLFLRVPGAPLDNNICERALKMSILHRKNSYFYKTLRGAEVGDLYMSLIYTCRFCGVDPFDYLTQLQRHEDQVASAPEAWMPWNYPAGTAATTPA